MASPTKAAPASQEQRLNANFKTGVEYGPCPVCQTAPLRTVRQRYCSTRCRARAWQRRQAKAQAERDAEIRELLKAALERLEERACH